MTDDVCERCGLRGLENNGVNRCSSCGHCRSCD